MDKPLDLINLYGRTFCGCGCGAEFFPQQKQNDFYQFTVTDVADIDLNRIVREQFEMGNLVTLLTDGKEPKGLLVHESFLEKFRKEDHLELLGEWLAPEWGFSKVKVFYDNKSFFVEASSSYLPQEGIHFRKLHRNEQLPPVKTELAAARAFTRKITVKVHSL